MPGIPFNADMLLKSCGNKFWHTIRFAILLPELLVEVSAYYKLSLEIFDAGGDTLNTSLSCSLCSLVSIRSD